MMEKFVERHPDILLQQLVNEKHKGKGEVDSCTAYPKRVVRKDSLLRRSQVVSGISLAEGGANAVVALLNHPTEGIR